MIVLIRDYALQWPLGSPVNGPVWFQRSFSLPALNDRPTPGASFESSQNRICFRVGYPNKLRLLAEAAGSAGATVAIALA
jgi:hypothetical protein